MPTADPTAGRYNPADRVIVIVDFDSFLARERDYNYMTPQWLKARIQEHFGTVVIPCIVTQERVSFKGYLPARKRPLTTIARWTEAGFRLIVDLQNADRMNAVVLREIEATQAHTFIWVGEYGVFRWFDKLNGLLDELKKRDIKLAILSPNQNGFLHGHADEEIHFNDATLLRLWEMDALPKRLRPQEVPHPLKQLEWKDPDTHAQVCELLGMERKSLNTFFKGLCHQLREGTLPDLVLALLLVLAIPPFPQDTQFLDLDLLANQLEDYAVDDPRETVERALWILYEINTPGLDYTIQPNWAISFTLQDRPNQLGVVRELARQFIHTYPRGQALLDKICASLEIFCCNRPSITPEEVGYLQDWLSLHGKRLLPSDVHQMQPDNLRSYAKTHGTPDDRERLYKRFGVRRLDHIDDFEKRVMRIIDEGQASQDTSCDLNDEPAPSAVRAAA